VSVAALAAASFADAYTSRGKYEANPMLRDASGRASMARMLAFKSGLVGGTVLLEYLLARKEPAVPKSAAIVNFYAAGALTGVAIRNSRIPGVEAAP